MSWQGSSCSVGSFRRRSAFATSLSRRRERASRAFQEKTCPGLDPDSIRAGEHRQIQCPLPALRIGPCQKALMSRLPEPSDSNYDACGWIAEGMISEFLENGPCKGELYVGRRHRGAGRLCGVAAIRGSSGTCPRSLQERPARYI